LVADPTQATAAPPLVGVLALQGGFEAHERVLERLGARVREVRVPAELVGLDGLVIPGGESTTMTLGVEREALAEPLRELAAAGVPVLGSCAGLIMLDREHLGVMDMRARRNAFGRQLHSFEADLHVIGVDGGPLRGVFIRAPWIEEHGPDVEILASVDGHGVAARQGRALAVAFHAELSGDDRVHRMFLALVRDARGAASPRAERELAAEAPRGRSAG
jgi:pyridoxal 5'-phosphate synthase pdxT subunit